MARPTPSQIGALAESLAVVYLQHAGVRILARNLRCRAGELDIVCQDGALLVIVEVRWRARRDFGGARASVTPAKQRRLIRAAQFHWQRHPEWHSRTLRFDVIALQAHGRQPPTIEWIKDAFRTT